MASSEIIEVLGEEYEGGLSAAEYDLVSRVHRVCVWLARHRSRKKVVEEIIEEFGCDEAAAVVWISKAQEFMALGMIGGADKAREMYHHRLLEIYEVAMRHATKDRIKTVTKPTKVVGPDGQFRVINGTHVTVEKDVLDSAALGLALKAAREIAHVQGARPRDGGGPRSLHVENLQINNGQLPQANQTDQLTNASLAMLLGAEVVEEADGTVHARGAEAALAGGEGGAPDAEAEGG